MIISIQQFVDSLRRWIISFVVVVFLLVVSGLSRHFDLISVGWQGLPFVIIIPFFYYFSVLLEKGIAGMVYRYSSVRKFILKEHFIEGDWIEILYDKGKMESVAFLQIVYERNNQYTIKGESYTLSGEYRGSFLTPNTTYYESEFALGYSYSGKLKEAVIAGTGILAFVLGEDSVHSFSGHLLDNFHAKGATFEGERIYDPNKIASLRAKKDFMREYIMEKILLQKEKTVY
jgi:hypothetical protein